MKAALCHPIFKLWFFCICINMVHTWIKSMELASWQWYIFPYFDEGIRACRILWLLLNWKTEIKCWTSGCLLCSLRCEIFIAEMNKSASNPSMAILAALGVFFYVSMPFLGFPWEPHWIRKVCILAKRWVVKNMTTGWQHMVATCHLLYQTTLTQIHVSLSYCKNSGKYKIPPESCWNMWQSTCKVQIKSTSRSTSFSFMVRLYYQNVASLKVPLSPPQSKKLGRVPSLMFAISPFLLWSQLPLIWSFPSLQLFLLSPKVILTYHFVHTKFQSTISHFYPSSAASI